MKYTNYANCLMALLAIAYHCTNIALQEQPVRLCIINKGNTAIEITLQSEEESNVPGETTSLLEKTTLEAGHFFHSYKIIELVILYLNADRFDDFASKRSSMEEILPRPKADLSDPHNAGYDVPKGLECIGVTPPIKARSLLLVVNADHPHKKVSVQTYSGIKRLCSCRTHQHSKEDIENSNFDLHTFGRTTISRQGSQRPPLLAD